MYQTNKGNWKYFAKFVSLFSFEKYLRNSKLFFLNKFYRSKIKSLDLMWHVRSNSLTNQKQEIYEFHNSKIIKWKRSFSIKGHITSFIDGFENPAIWSMQKL